MIAGRMGGRGGTTLELDVLDELLLLLDDPATPLNVHCELRVEGALDPERVEGAIVAAAERHPMARARLVKPRLRDRRYRWEIGARLDPVPLRVADCADDAALAREREELLRTTPALDAPGPFRALVAHHPAGDALVLNLHHAAGDGASAIRLITAIARAYAGEDDSVPDVDPVAVRDVRALLGRSPGARLRRARGMGETLRRVVRGPVRMALPPGGPPAGYGFELFTLEAAEVAALREHGPPGSTLNDLLLGGLAVTLRRWNERHGGTRGPVYLMMPVNVRPGGWRTEVFGNFAPWIGVRVGPAEQGDASAAAAAAGARVRRIRRLGLAGMLVDLWEPAYELPVAVKRLVPPVLPLASRFTVETAELSNMGRIDGLPAALGDAGAVSSFWWTPPGWPKLGASFSAGTFGDRLHIGLRYRHAVMSPAAAAELAELYRAELTAPDVPSDARRELTHAAR